MKFFTNKKRTLAEIVKDIEALPPEELDELKGMLVGKDFPPPEDDAAQAAEGEAEESAEAKTDATDATDAEAAQDETGSDEIDTAEDGGEAEQPPVSTDAPDNADAPDEGEEPSTEASEPDEASGEDTAELYRMIEDLKKTVEALAARINADAENGEGDDDDGKVEFGISQGSGGNDAPPESELDHIKAKYWNL